MLKLSFKLKFWLVVGLQIIILISVWGFNQIQFIGGERVLLEIVPLRDPLSLLQSHYLRLDYEISELNKEELPGYYGIDLADFRNGDKIYVVLKKEAKYWRAYGVSRSRPKGEISIKGTVVSAYRDYLRVKYGIESYFIPEKNWPETERFFRQARRDQDIFIEVSIGRFGAALIRKIFIGSEEIDISKIGTVREISKPKRGGARDVRIMSDLAQVRSIAVLVQNDKGSYAEICESAYSLDTNNSSGYSSDLQTIQNDIAYQQGGFLILYCYTASPDAYCVSAQLGVDSEPTGTGNKDYYCVDSTGIAITSRSGNYCDPVNATCAND